MLHLKMKGQSSEISNVNGECTHSGWNGGAQEEERDAVS